MLKKKWKADKVTEGGLRQERTGARGEDRLTGRWIFSHPFLCSGGFPPAISAASTVAYPMLLLIASSRLVGASGAQQTLAEEV